VGIRSGLLWLAVIAAAFVALEGNQETGFEHRGVWAIDGRGQILPTESFGCLIGRDGQSRCSSKRTAPFVPGRREAHLGVRTVQLSADCAAIQRNLGRKLLRNAPGRAYDWCPVLKSR